MNKGNIVGTIIFLQIILTYKIGILALQLRRGIGMMNVLVLIE